MLAFNTNHKQAFPPLHGTEIDDYFDNVILTIKAVPLSQPPQPVLMDRNFLMRNLRVSSYPVILVHHDKHETPMWICNTLGELLSGLRAMVQSNFDKGYYGMTIPLMGALTGNNEALVRFAQGRRDAEYEEWRLETPESHTREPE